MAAMATMATMATMAAARKAYPGRVPASGYRTHSKGTGPKYLRQIASRSPSRIN